MYVAEHVQIGKGKGGVRPVAQNGRVVVGEGRFRLEKSDGTVIAEAPLAEAEVTPGTGLTFSITWVTIGAEKYSLALGAGGFMLLGGMLRLFVAKSGQKKLLAAIVAEGGVPTSPQG